MNNIGTQHERRKVEMVVLSDVHLGTYGCHAKELCSYLSSIQPEKLILNGDIIDVWQFSKRYFPAYHMQVIMEIMQLISLGTKVYYITGNHDEMLRKFAGFHMGNITLTNKLLLDIDGKKTWIFHGDVFDVTMKNSRWLAKLGSVGYDLLILINRFVNFIYSKVGKGKISLSKTIKNSVKSAVSFIGNFEQTCAGIAISNGYDYVICGHIHQPVIKEIKTEDGTVMYLNSGDWIENLTTLEYNNKQWKLYHYEEEENAIIPLPKIESAKTLMKKLVIEFDNLKTA
jgi:UDP-2,3-diacylglucosamine pyrophosphatase LpxH